MMPTGLLSGNPCFTPACFAPGTSRPRHFAPPSSHGSWHTQFPPPWGTASNAVLVFISKEFFHSPVPAFGSGQMLPFGAHSSMESFIMNFFAFYIAFFISLFISSYIFLFFYFRFFISAFLFPHFKYFSILIFRPYFS